MRSLSKILKEVVVYGMAMSMAAPATSFAAARPSPAPVYRAPAPVYRAPAPVYRAPAPVYRAPAPVYRAPAPAPVYRAPAPAPVYRAPAPAPAPVANRPAPVQSRPSTPVATKPATPVTTRPSTPVTAKPNPVATKPAEPAKPTTPVATKPSIPANNPPITKPVGNKPVATNPTRPQPGTKPTQKPVSVDPARMPKPGSFSEKPVQIAQHKGPSQLDNKYTQRNIASARTNVTVIKNNVRVNNLIINNNRVFNDRFAGGFRESVGIRQGYYSNYGWHNYYHGFWGVGFYGGFYYPFRPCYDISTYFWYPSLYWLYQDMAADALYVAWYGNAYYNSYPVTVFPYVGVYYPTETLRDVGIEVSAYPAEKQTTFRAAMIKLTEGLAQQLANNMGASVTLSTNDVVITNYQNLADKGYSMEGYIDSKALNIHVGFKAFVDLVNADQTLVFIPTSDQSPGADLSNLTLINDKITALGGNPLIADVETDVASAQ